MKKYLILLALLLVLPYLVNYIPLPRDIKRQLSLGPDSIRVAIQPFQGMPHQAVEEVAQTIHRYYGFAVEVLPPIPLPAQAYTPNIPKLQAYGVPNRYRADSLIRYLKKTKPPRFDYVLGLTHWDISTTKRIKGEIKTPEWMYRDWGIFGLGFRPGPSCLVSTARLYRYTDAAGMRSRLRKIASHELGHNLGLPHCPNPACFMRDALERMSTIDSAQESLCPACQLKVKTKVSF